MQRNCVKATLRMVYGDDAIERRHFWRLLRQPRSESLYLVTDGYPCSSAEILVEFNREIESELLGTLDEHMNSESNRGFPNPMMLGLCIRRLSLSYRRELILSKAFENLTRRYQGLPDPLLSIPGHQEGVRNMYDGCISAYSKVYHKGKSPYSLIWRSQDHIEEFGNDAGLAEMFEQIRTEERIFCASTTLLRLTFLIPNYNRRGS